MGNTLVKDKLAVDIGGTFTDVVLEIGKRRFSTKVLTYHEAPEESVLRGIDHVMAESGHAPDMTGMLIHGTTLATNALIERKGARTGFVTTAGFRDILEMGFEKRFAQYHLDARGAAPLVPRHLRFEVAERKSAGGDTITILDETALLSIIPAIRDAGIEALAVGFLHAYADDRHERLAAEILSAELPDVTICRSSEICPEIREYERFSTTVANAYIRPLMSGYLLRLRARLAGKGFNCPTYLMMSGGGLTTLDQAVRTPIRLVESGPAGGAILAADIAKARGTKRLMAFDMGGTTAKICLIDNGQPERSRKFEVARAFHDMKGSGLPVRIPVIEMVEIGAGGGSIARVDELRQIRVGPDSAGSDPGPVAYQRGGTQPSVTDANLVLGKIDPEKFAGGQITLDDTAAMQAITRHIGAPLELNGIWPAVGIVEIVDENMANAARVHAIERGKQPSEYTMVAFGGGAPLHAARLADKLGIDQVIIPVSAGVGSAIGFLLAPVSYEVVRSWRCPLSANRLEEMNRLLAAMREEAIDTVRAGAGTDNLIVTGHVELRYRGQGHEMPVALPDLPLTLDDLTQVHARFEAQYKRVFGLTMPELNSECISWSISAATKTAPGTNLPPMGTRTKVTPAHYRDVYDPSAGKSIPHGLFARISLNAGDNLEGPAVVTEPETSTIVPAGFSLMVDEDGAMIINRRTEKSQL